MDKIQASPLLYRKDFEHDACGVGLLANINGERSHALLQKSLQALKNLAHRGAVDADAITGDGAGILTQIPHQLFREFLEDQGKQLFNDDDLGVGVIFLPRNDDYAQAHGRKIIENAVEAEGLSLLAWRYIPVDPNCLGRKADRTQPHMVQALIAKTGELSPEEYERKLFLARKTAEREAEKAELQDFYICSFSCRTIIYKGMLNSPQVRKYFPDLRDPSYTTNFVIFHQRYSTNTFPQWHLAQPFRMMAHNGEINTIRGNRNLMRARENSNVHGIWGERFADLRPMLQPDMSDSASFDNTLELLTLGGRSALQAVTMMMPPAWENNSLLDDSMRGFYEYHACMLEPWDGPAAIAFTDGRYVAASLDRNGLRPARYKIYEDGTFMLASELGLIDETDMKTLRSGRLGPGKMLAIDMQEHKFLDDAEIKAQIGSDERFHNWCHEHLVDIQSYSAESKTSISNPDDEEIHRQLAFGYEKDEYDIIFKPMAESAMEAIGSMGDDTPLAFLSRKPRLLYTYFRQLFAQVTNPPIDSIRERSVMSLNMFLGGRLGLFEDLPQSAGFIKTNSPVLFNNELSALFDVKFLKDRVIRLDATYDVSSGAAGLEAAIKDLISRAQDAVESKAAKLIVLSDRNVSKNRIAIPMLLAVGAVHQHLVKTGYRMKCDIVAESGEARDVHHIACLLGFGANAVNPYIALAIMTNFADRGELEGVDATTAAKNYRTAIDKGLLKIMGKMGISTLFSYCRSQMFEAIGISQTVIDECFTGTPSPIGGIGYELIAEEALARHKRAYDPELTAELESEGYYKVIRKGGEFHAWNPKVVGGMHRFLKTRKKEDYDNYRQQSDEHQPYAIKDLLRIKYPDSGVDISQVEEIEDIRRRFCTAGMSLGALSPECHETLAIAMNRIGGKSNSGEGGEEPRRYSLLENGDNAASAIKQVASGRFGVTAEYLASAKEIEIKIAQGAKPGEGGQLPGHKVSPLIAKLRFSVPGVTLISPPPHHDIYSIEDLAQLIFDLKEVNPRAKVCVKLVSSSGVGTVAAGVAKAYADVILVSGHDGGTAASPLSSVKYAGSSWEIGIAETHQVLMMNGLRNRVTLRTDGGMKTGRDIIIAAILGAEEFNFGTSAMIAASCAMFRVCHLNTCPVGVATQRDDLRAKYKGTAENVINFFNAVAEDVRYYLAKLGVRKLDHLVGRTEFLEQIDDPENAKTATVNLSGLLHNPDPSGEAPRIHTRPRNERLGFDGSLDNTIIQESHDVVVGRAASFSGKYRVGNTDRCLGTKLSGEVAYVRGNNHLPPGSIDLVFKGTAGQSFCTLLTHGIKVTLLGEANDYVGKVMSGGEIIIRPGEEQTYDWTQNTLLGNTCLYGATGGNLFAAGLAGERFGVRNSGAVAVVEGVGDHACEYMTGGLVVCLGKTGTNFGAGMSGGLAFVYDADNVFEHYYNPAMVDIERIGDNGEIDALRKVVKAHFENTQSPHAKALLDDWQKTTSKFWKVVPKPSVPDMPKNVLRIEELSIPTLSEPVVNV
ncbi:glutamate synthase large subunit [Pelagicoccus sp. NFK12]|uniref:Glutamate synthase [NADPH] large chain n=1 Tax=Pelagicoccus enzymogenes TaxID=2773457 RepID=A0A927FCP5_9BACT|nr:glutamate synthase large subunit [Pelagicoccus enzymogenes]MBD5780993.1 glutamate synthase large subunit [Pelagicoccus enzymogenes]MDQ8198682.1 glutamate synthase large subunit [Pelagicoccus enzymogenes]